MLAIWRRSGTQDPILIVKVGSDWKVLNNAGLTVYTGNEGLTVDGSIAWSSSRGRLLWRAANGLGTPRTYSYAPPLVDFTALPAGRIWRDVSALYVSAGGGDCHVYTFGGTVTP